MSGNSTTDASEGTAEEAGSWLEPAGMGKSIVRGSIVGTLTAFVAITGLLRLAGVEWWSALGLGAFIGFWGGIGFGSMLAGVIWVSRPEVTGHSSGHVLASSTYTPSSGTPPTDTAAH